MRILVKGRSAYILAGYLKKKGTRFSFPTCLTVFLWRPPEIANRLHTLFSSDFLFRRAGSVFHIMKERYYVLTHTHLHHFQKVS